LAAIPRQPQMVIQSRIRSLPPIAPNWALLQNRWQRRFLHETTKIVNFRHF
jgi:hypothetical protein